MRKKKQSQDDESAGAPEWMVTFSDCMTLLLTFFVLLLSFSSFDDRVFMKLRIIFANALPTVSTETKSERDAFLPTDQSKPTEEPYKGSEKPTLEFGRENQLKKETGYEDFRARKVFLCPSKEVFLGKGTAISLKGQRNLANMADYLRKIPGRIVISENLYKSNNTTGLSRAWAVIEYLTSKEGLSIKRFSISAMSTIGQDRYENDLPEYAESETERGLEIVLLDRSIYN